MTPFVSKAQVKKCFSLKDPNWDCMKWIEETKDVKKLPVKKRKKRKKKVEVKKEKKIKGVQEFKINYWGKK